MKTIVVFLAIFCVTVLGQLTDEQRTKLNAYKQSCISETGVDATVVENAKKGQIAESDEKLDCFATCLLKKIGIMNADETINIDVVRQKAPSNVSKEQIDTLIDQCKDISGNGCAKGGNVMKCFLENKTFTLLPSES